MNGLQRRALGFLLGEWISPATSTSSEIFLGSYVGNCYYKMQGGRRWTAHVPMVIERLSLKRSTWMCFNTVHDAHGNSQSSQSLAFPRADCHRLHMNGFLPGQT